MMRADPAARGSTPSSWWRLALLVTTAGCASGGIRVTIPEGFTRFQVASRLQKHHVCTEAAFLSATKDERLLLSLGIAGESAEGYLFPDTYTFRRETDAAEVVARMANTFWAKTRTLFLGGANGLPGGEKSFPGSARGAPSLPPASVPGQLGFAAHDVVIVASIVEKEAAVAAERGTIAGVFYNRLMRGSFVPKRLQADPTVSYGCLDAPEEAPSCAGFRGRITGAMLRDEKNPYNTYRHDGLPPGPIANPGIAALTAAVHPARHDYLYFVAKGGGQHVFSRTLDDHAAAVRRYRSRAP